MKEKNGLVRLAQMVLSSTPDTESSLVVGLAPDLIGTVRALVEDSLGIIGKSGALKRVRAGWLVPAPSISKAELLAMSLPFNLRGQSKFHIRDSAVPRAADAAAGSRCLGAFTGDASEVVNAVLDLIANGIAPVSVARRVALNVSDL